MKGEYSNSSCNAVTFSCYNIGRISQCLKYLQSVCIPSKPLLPCLTHSCPEIVKMSSGPNGRLEITEESSLNWQYIWKRFVGLVLNSISPLNIFWSKRYCQTVLWKAPHHSIQTRFPSLKVNSEQECLSVTYPFTCVTITLTFRFVYKSHLLLGICRSLHRADYLRD